MNKAKTERGFIKGARIYDPRHREWGIITLITVWENGLVWLEIEYDDGMQSTVTPAEVFLSGHEVRSVFINLVPKEPEDGDEGEEV